MRYYNNNNVPVYKPRELKMRKKKKELFRVACKVIGGGCGGTEEVLIIRARDRTGNGAEG